MTQPLFDKIIKSIHKIVNKKFSECFFSISLTTSDTFSSSRLFMVTPLCVHFSNMISVNKKYLLFHVRLLPHLFTCFELSELLLILLESRKLCQISITCCTFKFFRVFWPRGFSGMFLFFSCGDNLENWMRFIVWYNKNGLKLIFSHVKLETYDF